MTGKSLHHNMVNHDISTNKNTQNFAKCLSECTRIGPDFQDEEYKKLIVFSQEEKLNLEFLDDRKDYKIKSSANDSIQPSDPVFSTKRDLLEDISGKKYLRSLHSVEESKNLISQDNNVLTSSVYDIKSVSENDLQREPFNNKDLQQTWLKSPDKTELGPCQLSQFEINFKCLLCGFEFNQEGCGENSKASNPGPKLLQSTDLKSISLTFHKSTLQCPKCSAIVGYEDKECLDSGMPAHFEDNSLTNFNRSDISLPCNANNKEHLKCSYCEYTTSIRGHFKLHQLRHSQLKFKCSECRYKTDKENSLEQHSAHPFKCQDCDFHTYLESALVKHNETNCKTGYLSCDSCTFVTSNKGELKIHKLNKCEVRPAFKCTKCDFQTKEKGHFNLHLLKHTRRVEAQHFELSEIKLVNEQPVRSISKSELNFGDRKPVLNVFDHSIIAHNERLYICPSCNFETSGERKFRKHINTHPEWNSNKYRCSLCNYTSRHRSGYRIHVLNHSGKYLFQCKCCDYKTNNKSNFRLHAKVHSKELSCCFCTFKTSQRLHLKLHLISHSNLSVKIFGKENNKG